jgi:tricorn protease
MTRIRSGTAAVVAALVLAAASHAQEPIRFARTPDISPDGKLVAFSYLGDIWVVETIGGVARPVTLHEAHDYMPVFSPDGRMLAFSSNRHGSYDVFVVPVEGGRPRRLTFDSASDFVNGWSPDGKNVLFTSLRDVEFPLSSELYTVPVEGGRGRRISACEGRDGVYSPAGDKIAYVRGPGTWYRKGYRGSSNDDVWISNADGTSNRQLTTFNGQDGSPMWSPDGKFIYYVSECHGTPANIVRQDAAGQTAPEPVTFHCDDGVRRARISRNGEWIVYECGADLWVVSAIGQGSPRKLAIEVHADDKTNTERVATFTHGASEFALSPDEHQVAFAVHGELFLMPVAGGKATRLTDDPALDHAIAWSPDNKKILFASDRGGQEDLYLLESDDAEHPELAKAHKFKTTRLTNDPDAEVGASFAPDGKHIAFLRAGKLWTMNPDGTGAKVVVGDVQVFDYDWSPDSKQFVFARQDGSFASELFLVPVDASTPPKNITRYATYNGGVTWSSTGGKLAFISQRRHESTMFVLSLQKPAAPGVPETRGTDIDWEDIHLRAKQVAALPAEEGAISPDGARVAFRSTSSGRDDLWVASSDGSHLARLTSGSVQPTQIQWSKRTPDLIYFRDGHGHLRTARAGGGDTGLIAFKAKMTVRRDEEFREMFAQSWRALRESFYDPHFHGTDWDAVRAKYQPLVRHVALKEDLYALISLMLGELNASHLGISGLSARPEERTAELGLLFDERYTGPGFKVREVVKRGPADRRGITIKPADIIRAIDDVVITPKVGLDEVLNDKAGEVVTLQVASDPSADRKTWRTVQIQPVTRDEIAQPMYERWVEHNAKRVAELSGGRLGYIHIASMDDEGLDQFVRALYSDNFDKDAIVLDVRYNGGGFTHDQVLNYLGAKEHTFFRQRYGGGGTVLRPFDRKWSRPLVLLINNRSYSDAEIFPSAFRALGLGKLVGQTTGAHVIGTTSIELIDGSTLRIPRTGVYTARGVDMEREGVIPDVQIQNDPDQLARGQDAQLDAAVRVLGQTVVEWKKDHAALAHQPSEGGKPVATAVSQRTGHAPPGK